MSPSPERLAPEQGSNGSVPVGPSHCNLAGRRREPPHCSSPFLSTGESGSGHRHRSAHAPDASASEQLWKPRLSCRVLTLAPWSQPALLAPGLSLWVRREGGQGLPRLTPTPVERRRGWDLGLSFTVGPFSVTGRRGGRGDSGRAPKLLALAQLSPEPNETSQLQRGGREARCLSPCPGSRKRLPPPSLFSQDVPCVSSITE